MSTTPREALELFFAQLNQRQIPYVVLHSYESYPDVVPSDVDLAVQDPAWPTVRKLVWEAAEKCGWVVGQVFQHEICAVYFVLIDPNHPESFLKLDICSHYVRNGDLFLRDEDLLKDRREYRSFHIPCPSSEFAYTLAKVFAKHKKMSDYVPRLQELSRQEPERSEQLFESLTGQPQGGLREWFARPAEAWYPLGASMHTRKRYSWSQRLREYQRRIRRILQPSGLRLAFLGPDGVGKSTVISCGEPLVAPCFRKQRMFHFCPMLFRPQTGVPVTEPHHQVPRTLVVSWIKVGYHFADHWIGFLIQQLPAIIRSTCIIFDRNFDDLLVDPARYRIQRAAPLIRWLRTLLPPADLTFVLDAPGEIIHKRKPELSVDELNHQRAALRELGAANPRFVIISANDSTDRIARAVSREVINFLAAREKRRELAGR